jgi:hypothetical protein
MLTEAVISRLVHGLVDALGQGPGGLVGILEGGGQHDELVATEPGDGVPDPDDIAQALGHGLEEDVPAGVAEPVVDGLEVVQVQEQQHGPGLAAVGGVGHLLEPVGEQRPVGEAGELVVEGPMGERRLLGPELLLE